VNKKRNTSMDLASAPQSAHMRGIVARNGRCKLIHNLPLPIPGPNQVLIKVASTALNRADTLQRRGLYPPPAGVTEVLGLELAGTVVETGEPVMALVSGGAFAEFCVADRGSVMPVPKQVGLKMSAAIPEVPMRNGCKQDKNSRLASF
jgi:NADPH2:quinone reductase